MELFERTNHIGYISPPGIRHADDNLTDDTPVYMKYLKYPEILKYFKIHVP